MTTGGKRILVEPQPITPTDLVALLSEPPARPLVGAVATEEFAEHLGDALSATRVFRELDWHIRESGHLTAAKSAFLRTPVLGKWIRDQHEINRVLLISIEKAAALLGQIEEAVGRHFCRLRTERRAHWAKRFRYLGTRWKIARPAMQAFREAWEHGRSPAWRLRSAADQNRINAETEQALVALGEILTTLMESIREGLPGLESLEEHEASCLWHAREGKAVREAAQAKPGLLRPFLDPQRELNRLYRISLEELSFLLKEQLRHLDRMGSGSELFIHH